MTLWEELYHDNFPSLYYFSTTGCAFIHYPQTVNKKLILRPQFTHFISMEGDKHLKRFYILTTQSVCKVRI